MCLFNLIGACDVDARWGRFFGLGNAAALSLDCRVPQIFEQEARWHPPCVLKYVTHLVAKMHNTIRNKDSVH
jgi:hypothetical protein